MQEIRTIVVPVDLDKHTEQLIEYALFMASALDAKPIFLHAVEFMAMGEIALGNISYDDFNAQRIEQAEKRLKELLAANKQQTSSLSCRVIGGDVVDEIMGFAKKHMADLVIMGTHGKRGIEKILLGSVAERVLKGAHCPVLIMNPYRG